MLTNFVLEVNGTVLKLAYTESARLKPTGTSAFRDSASIGGEYDKRCQQYGGWLIIFRSYVCPSPPPCFIPRRKGSDVEKLTIAAVYARCWILPKESAQASLKSRLAARHVRLRGNSCAVFRWLTNSRQVGFPYSIRPRDLKSSTNCSVP
jgi:hypothetical protein